MSSNRTRLFATSLLAGAATIALPLLTTAVIGLAPSIAAAQDYTTSDLNGRVLTDNGKPVSGATVTVRSEQGQTRTTTTGANGLYHLAALPAGSYVANVTAPGYPALSNQHLTIQGTASSIDFTLTSAATVSEVVVTGASHAGNNFTQTTTGLSVNVQELSSRVPVARNVTSIVMLAPSVTLADPTIVANGERRPGQNLVSISGTSAAEQVYYINGLNVTDQRTFLGFADMPYDAMQSVDVMTGGYQAEFGRATGGVINMVTRSGSNDFHAGASLYYTPNALRSNGRLSYNSGGAAGAETLGQYSASETIDPDVYISGPLLKDHVFFFGIINPREVTTKSAVATNGLTGSDATTGSQAWTKVNSPRWLTKFDFDITDKQRIEATVFSDAANLYTTNYQWDQTGGLSSPTTTKSKSGGLDQIYHYTGVWTDWFTLSALYGVVNNQYTDESPSLSIPMVMDRTRTPSPNNPTGGNQFLTAATAAGPYELGGEDHRKTYRIDGDFYFHLFGDHHIKVGYDDEELTSTDKTSYSGGYYEYVYNTAYNPIPTAPVAGQGPYSGDYVRQTVYLSGGVFHATQAAEYLEDTWRVTPFLTLNLGVRNDMYNYKTGSGLSFIKTNNQVAPRVGFTWDPFEEGRDKVWASFGRYYLPIAENTAIREAAAAPFYRNYYQATRDASGNLVVNSDGTPKLGPQVAQTLTYSGTQAPDPGIIASQNIKPMFTQEFIIGWEHTFRDLSVFNGFFNGWKFGVDYVDRNLGDTIEDTQLENNGVGPFYNYCARTNTSCANAGDQYASQFTLFNPGSPVIVMADLAGTGTPQRIVLTNADLGNMPKAKDHYQALEFTFNRPFDGTWGLQGSYVLGKDYGNYEGAVKSDIGQTDTSITQDFDQYFYEIGATGYLPNDHRHTIKLFGTYSPIENFLIGVNAQFQSGRHFGCLGYINDLSIDPAPSPTPSEWFCSLGPNGTTIPTPRGSRIVTPWTSNVDVMLQYTFPTPSDFGKARVELDVFNLFNTQTVTRIQEQGDVGGFPGTPLQTYGLPRTYSAPRSVRFGVHYAF